MSDSLPPVLTPAEPGEGNAIPEQISRLSEAMGKFSDGIKESMNKVTESFKEKGNELMDGVGKSLLGPFRLITEPLLGVSNAFTPLKGGFSGLKDAFSGRVMPKRNELLNSGVQGASAVYLADEIKRAMGGEQEGIEMPGGDGLMSRLFGRGGAGGGGRIRGLGRILATAGPWAALVGVIAGTAVAFRQEWDKEAESMGEEIRDIWQDDNATLLQKLGVTLKNVGKGIFGALAGGVREVTEGVGERVSNIREIWQDDERGTLSKVAGTVGNVVAGAAEAGVNFVRGFGRTINDGIIGLFPEDRQERIREQQAEAKEKIQNFFSNTGEFFGNIGSNIGNFARNIGSSVGNFFTEGVPNFFGRIRENVTEKGAQARQLFSNVREKVGGIFSNIGGSVRDFFGRVTGRAEQEASSADGGGGGAVRSFFQNIGGTVQSFFSDVEERGFGTVASEKVTELIGNVRNFFNGVGEKISGFFSGIRESVNANVERKAMIDMLGGTTGFFGNLFGNDSDEYDQMIERYRRTMGMGDARVGQVRRAMEQDTAFLQSEMSRRGLTLPEQSVDDALITSDGKVIRFDPRDNIFATQRDLGQMGMEAAMTAAEQNAMGGGAYGQEIYDAIVELTNVLQNKNMNPVVQQTNNQLFEVDKFRFDTVR